MEQKKRDRKKMNNTGSTIVSVIVVIAFISILATTLLYISGMNYYMKITDQKTKESFYEAETALEEIKAVLDADAADAAHRAYMDVLINYSAKDTYNRNLFYKQKFFDYLIENWNKHTVGPAGPLSYEQAIQSLVESQYQAAITLSPAIPNAGEVVGIGDHAYLRGVELKYLNSGGYYTQITTDYIIEVPFIDLSVDACKKEYIAGDSMKRDKFDLTGCVKYSNWTKR